MDGFPNREGNEEEEEGENKDGDGEIFRMGFNCCEEAAELDVEGREVVGEEFESVERGGSVFLRMPPPVPAPAPATRPLLKPNDPEDDIDIESKDPDLSGRKPLTPTFPVPVP